jgi:hypothetical protein
MPLVTHGKFHLKGRLSKPWHNQSPSQFRGGIIVCTKPDNKEFDFFKLALHCTCTPFDEDNIFEPFWPRDGAPPRFNVRALKRKQPTVRTETRNGNIGPNCLQCGAIWLFSYRGYNNRDHPGIATATQQRFRALAFPRDKYRTIIARRANQRMGAAVNSKY